MSPIALGWSLALMVSLLGWGIILFTLYLILG